MILTKGAGCECPKGNAARKREERERKKERLRQESFVKEVKTV